MRSVILFICLFFLGAVAQAQDLILTTQGDSLHCTITLIEPSRLFYTITVGEEPEHRDIPMTQVAMYQKSGSFPVIVGEVGLRKAWTAQQSQVKRWMLSASGGYAHRTAQVPPMIEEPERGYIEKLRSGYYASASLHWFVDDMIAIGVEYNSMFGARNSMPITVMTTDSVFFDGLMADDVRLRYLGFDLLFRPVSLKKLSYFGSAGLGRLVYEDRATYINNFTITGRTVAFTLRAGAEYQVAKSVSVGAQLGYCVASLKRFTVDTGSATVKVTLHDLAQERVDRVDAGLVLRIHI